MTAPAVYLKPFTSGNGHTEKEVFRDDFPRIIRDAKIDGVPFLKVSSPQQSFLRTFFEREMVVLGYFSSSGWWVQAPNKDGKVFHIYFPCWSRRSVLAPMDRIWNHLSSKALHIFKISDSCGREKLLRDSKGRRYVLVRANEGYVPVRHGTDPDPRLKNWISTTPNVRIVYDSARYRHPAIEGLDYSSHGFRLYGKSWWPILNGLYAPTYKRVKSACDENYDVEAQPNKRIEIAALAGIVLGVAIHAASVGASGVMIARAAARDLVRPPLDRAPIEFNPLQFAADNAPFVLQGANAGQQPAQQVVHLHMMQQDRMKGMQKSRFEAQFETLEILKYQDSLDLGNELIQSLIDQDSLRTERLFRENPQILKVEHRGLVVIQAAIRKNHAAIRLCLADGLISDEDRSGALLICTELKDLVGVQMLSVGDVRILPEQLDVMLIMASRKGARSILRELLRKAPNPDGRGKAVIEAVKSDSLDMVNDLLEGNPDVSDEHHGQAVVLAARKDLALLTRLLDFRPVNQEIRGEAVIEAVKAGNVPNRRHILEKGPILLEHRIQAERFLLEHRAHEQQIQEAAVEL